MAPAAYANNLKRDAIWLPHYPKYLISHLKKTSLRIGNNEERVALTSSIPYQFYRRRKSRSQKTWGERKSDMFPSKKPPLSALDVLKISGTWHFCWWNSAIITAPYSGRQYQFTTECSLFPLVSTNVTTTDLITTVRLPPSNLRTPKESRL